MLYSTRNTVQYFIMTKWTTACKNIESLCYTPETYNVNQLYLKSKLK